MHTSSGYAGQQGSARPGRMKGSSSRVQAGPPPAAMTDPHLGRKFCGVGDVWLVQALKEGVHCIAKLPDLAAAQYGEIVAVYGPTVIGQFVSLYAEGIG